MRFYTKQHKYSCGIDLHTKKMYLCILDEAAEIMFHKNIRTNREALLNALKPFRYCRCRGMYVHLVLDR